MAYQTGDFAYGKGQREWMQQRASRNAKGGGVKRKGCIGLRFVVLHRSQLSKRARRTVPEERD
jgi:hypothetical protein